MFRISTIAFATLFLTMLFVGGDCRPQDTPSISVGDTLGGLTGTLTDIVDGLPPVIEALPPLIGAIGGAISPVGTLPLLVPGIGGSILT